jgi:uncharacterized membrane protein
MIHVARDLWPVTCRFRGVAAKPRVADLPERSRSEEGPSAWSHRLPVAALAVVGCAIATYLTLYQWHVTASVWDPIFGSRASERVLTSLLARLLPLPDATLGALAYLAEAAVTLVGGEQRWRSAPWAVVIYGLALAGLALTSVALVLTQVLLVHALCMLCLCSAAISLVNAWLGRGEVFATLRELGYTL